MEKVYKARLDTAFKMGSKIEIISLNREQTSNFALLGKIWGFLKYHHPNVAAGDYNWDFELFRIIPKILITTKSNRDKVLIRWIDSLGTIVPSESFDCEISLDAKQKPDYSWINKKSMSDKLMSKLLYIKKNHSRIENYYIKIGKDVVPLYFTNEESYDNQIFPDAGLRLLSLYRFWNIIQYYYPYKYAIKEELWEDVIEKLIPKFVEAKNVMEYHSALLSMLHSAHDSHIVLYRDLIGSIEGTSKPTIKVRFIKNQAVVYENSYVNNLIQLGDIILEKNDENIGNIVQRMLPFTPASNRTTQLRTIARELLFTNDTSIKLKILRGDSTFNIVLPTMNYFNDGFIPPNDNYALLSKDIGYIYLGTTKVKQLPIIFDKFSQTKGIILDLRNYPMDFELLYKLSEYLMPHSMAFAKLSRPSMSCPGVFHLNESVKVGIERTDYYKGKIVILVNEFTQSRAEFFAMAFKKAPNAIVIGSQTAGADGNFVNFSLPGGFQTGITGKGVYYPDGTETQRIGIVPDIEVKLTIKGIKEGRDEVLEKAIEYINSN